MDDVMVMEFLLAKLSGESKPDLVKQVDFLRRQVGGMRPEIEHPFLAARRENLEGQVWLGVREPLPGEPRETRLFGHGHLSGLSQDDVGRLETLSRAHNSVPDLV